MTQGKPRLLELAYAEEPEYASKVVPANRGLAELVLKLNIGENPQLLRVSAEWEAICTFGW